MELNQMYAFAWYKFIYWSYSFQSALKEALDTLTLEDVAEMQTDDVYMIFEEVWKRVEDKYENVADVLTGVKLDVKNVFQDDTE